MPAYQLLRCEIALGGDRGNTVVRDRSRPIVFPELPILQNMHGEEGVTDVHVVGLWDTSNEEVLQRIQQIYGTDVVKEVFPGARPRLPLSDPSIPRCTKPVYKPRPVGPDSPDPKLKPLDQFTVASDTPTLEAPPLEVEDDPTPDEIAAHAQDDDDPVPLPDDDDPTRPRPEDVPQVLMAGGRGTRGSVGGKRGAPTPSTLPDVNAGGSHPPEFERYTGQRRT